VSNLILERLAMIDPHPDGADAPTGAATSTDVLQDIERQVGSAIPVAGLPSRSGVTWRGPIVATVAFGIVVLVAIVAVIAGGGAEPAAPQPVTTTVVEQVTSTTVPRTTGTTVPSPTTVVTVPDTVSEVERSAADRVVEALNAADIDALFAAMSESAPVVTRVERLPTPTITRSRELFERYIRVDFAIGAQWTITKCSAASTRSSIRCELENAEPLREAFGLDTLPALLLIDVDESGLIESFDLRWDVAQPIIVGAWLSDLAPFNDWVKATYPDDFEVMTINDEQIRTSPESLELWTLRVAEFLDSSGVLP
jgi:hypothetical protein